MTSQEEDFEAKLSFASLDDDNKTILINGESSYSTKLPRGISRMKKTTAAAKQKMIEKTILNYCNSSGIDYVSEENVRNAAKEIVNQLYERARLVAKEANGSDVGGGAVGGDNGDNDDEEEKKNNRKASKALELAIKHSKELFVDEFGTPFAAMIMMDGHVEIHPMDEERFKNWICGIYYEEKNDLLSEEQLKKIVRILTAKAEFDGSIPRHRLDVRVRGYNKEQEQRFQVGNGHVAVDNVGNVGKIRETEEESGHQQTSSIYDVIQRAMTDRHGNNKGYFDVNDWKTAVMCLPSQHPLYCDEDQAEKILYALLDEGKIRETELMTDRFEPTEKIIQSRTTDGEDKVQELHLHNNQTEISPLPPTSPQKEN
jgi:hypothetical protein